MVDWYPVITYRKIIDAFRAPIPSLIWSTWTLVNYHNYAVPLITHAHYKQHYVLRWSVIQPVSESEQKDNIESMIVLKTTCPSYV